VRHRRDGGAIPAPGGSRAGASITFPGKKWNVKSRKSSRRAVRSAAAPNDGTTHHDFPRLLEDIAFRHGNRILVLTGTGDSFIASIDGPSLGDITKPMAADVLYTEGRRGVQRLADLEIPIIAAVNGPVSVHREYALLAGVVVASDTTVFSDLHHLAFGIAPGDGPAPAAPRRSCPGGCSAGPPRTAAMPADQPRQRPGASPGVRTLAQEMDRLIQNMLS
jgi:hypothetical protein